MGWRGRDWTNPWPGRGPFSHLPPWQRPGWLYGRGACWYLYGPYSATQPLRAEDEAAVLTEQKTMIEEQLKAMQETLKKIQERLNELKK
ncbi:MAG: DUF5320 domain-containing protein [Candidatus Bathyarchaeota archaeon]|nr:DUF5320 domain-containing protein [Candidatus Bathyarchaeota archaeon]